MSNVYNVLFTPPASKLAPNLEKLATSLVKSGLLRIDAHDKMNFVRFPVNGQIMFFSHRQIFDKHLNPRLKRNLGSSFVLLEKEISKNQKVPQVLELKLARLLVQSAHPSVIGLILQEQVEVFISYSHNIADLMELEHWQTHGANSGMQSVGFNESRVFVSCDGDPFDTDKETAAHTKYALSRFMIIAGQELGHFSDLMRDSKGFAYSRFSIQPRALKSRRLDIEQVEKATRIFEQLNLSAAARKEKAIVFLKKHRRYSFKHLSALLASYLATKRLQSMAAKKFNIPIATLHDASALSIMLADMRFNLTPRAPVYERQNQREQEQIWCIEALARVPQQVIKWGHKTTRFMYPNLYKYYYGTVIPACTKALRH